MTEWLLLLAAVLLTALTGFFVAAGFCAHGIAGAGGVGQVMAAWILDGDPGMDLWHMDVRRFGRHYRSPGYTLARTVENYESYYDIRYPAAETSSGRPETRGYLAYLSGPEAMLIWKKHGFQELPR